LNTKWSVDIKAAQDVKPAKLKDTAQQCAAFSFFWGIPRRNAQIIPFFGNFYGKVLERGFFYEKNFSRSIPFPRDGIGRMRRGDSRGRFVCNAHL
jgi:hypothetical protein